MSMTDKACCKSGSHPSLEQTSTWPLKGFKLMPEMIKGPTRYSLHHTLPLLRRIILKVQQFKFYNKAYRYIYSFVNEMEKVLFKCIFAITESVNSRVYRWV